MNDFLSTFHQRKGMLFETIWQHLQISLYSLIIAVVIAVPLGLFLTRHKRIAEPIIALAAILQTIPSLAVLAFLIPFFGIGTVPAIIALTAYGLLPVLRNTYTGINEVDPALREAATGMGMNSWRRLTKVELPLAMPVLMAGVRTSMVLIIGTTTIAALIGAGGLGELILLGLDRGGDISLILLGAIPAALLAIILDFILRGFEHLSKRIGFKAFIAMLVIALLVISTPFLFQGGKKDEIVIGGKRGPEPKILINMYKLLIEDKTDLHVKLKPGLGKTAMVFSALEKGSIDIYPEFTGTAIVTLLKEQADSNDAQKVYEQAREGMKNKFHLVLLKPMAYNNSYALAVKKTYAEKHGLKEIGDLKGIQNDVKAGFTLEFNDRQDGYKGIKKRYNLDLNVKTMEPGIRQKALLKGDVNIIDAYTTDSYMVKLHLTTLKDPKHLFPPYQGAPLIRESTLKKYPKIEKALNKLGGKITDKEMRQMNYEVDYENKSAEEVALHFLTTKGLLKK